MATSCGLPSSSVAVPKPVGEAAGVAGHEFLQAGKGLFGDIPVTAVCRCTGSTGARPARPWRWRWAWRYPARPWGGRAGLHDRRRCHRSRRAPHRRSVSSIVSASSWAQVNQRVFEGGLVERQQAIGEVGVIFEVGVVLGGAPRFPGAQQTAVAAPHCVEQKVRVLLSNARVVRAPQDSTRLRRRQRASGRSRR